MSENNSKISKRHILIAPDGGWGYIICISVTIQFVTITAFIGCFGMLFNDFIKEIDMTSTQVTLLGGVTAMCMAFSAFFASPILKIISLRKLAFIAVSIYDLGCLGTVFVKSALPFFVFYGVMQGAGLGLCYTVSCTILNEYFVQKRLLANSIVQTVTGLCTMFAPKFCSWCLDIFGFRGTLLFIAGISLQNLVASALMQPVEWHMKKVEVADGEEKQMILVEEKKNIDNNTPTVKATDIDISTIESAGQVYEFPPDPEKSESWRNALKSLIDLSLCKTFLISCPCIGASLIYFADSTYSVILPQGLYAANWDQESVTLALSSMLFGDLALRILLTFTNKWLSIIGSQGIFIIGIFIGFISRLGMLWSSNHIAIIIYIGFIGVSHGVYAVLLSVVVADVVAPEKFTSAIGMTLLLCGFLNLTLAPLVGGIRDLSNSYPTAFYVLTCVYAIVFLFWSIEIVYKKNAHKRRAREENLKRSSKLCKPNKSK